MYVNLTDLLLVVAGFIGFGLFIVVCVFMILALFHVLKIARKVNKLLDDNTDYVNRSLKKLPEVTENINRLSVSVRENADKAGSALAVIENTITGTAEAVGENTDNILSIVRIAGNVVKLIIDLFTTKD